MKADELMAALDRERFFGRGETISIDPWAQASDEMQTDYFDGEPLLIRPEMSEKEIKSIKNKMEYQRRKLTRSKRRKKP